MTIIIFFIVLAVLILVHEFGHFIIAKRSGIRVDEFGLGFPPRIWSFKYGETVYSLNIIPFGGFVKIYGETPDESSIIGPDSARSLVNKPKLIQAAVLFGGVLFNFLLAWLLFSIGFASGLPAAIGIAPAGSVIENVALTVVQVLPDSPAQTADLKTVDQIISLILANKKIEPKAPSDVQTFIKENGTEPITFTFKRGEELITKDILAEKNIGGSERAIGISMEEVGIVSLPIHLAIIEGAKYTAKISISMVFILGSLVADLFSGVSVSDTIVGPVGIVGLVGNAADLGFVYLLTFTALISINLAIINLIPFPALDGGRLLFLLIEAVKGSPLKPKIANTLNLIGFFLLIFLMLLVTYNDIARLL